MLHIESQLLLIILKLLFSDSLQQCLEIHCQKRTSRASSTEPKSSGDNGPLTLFLCTQMQGH